MVCYKQCINIIGTEKWDGRKVNNVNKISFAPKDFYDVLNRHVKKKNKNRRGETQEVEGR